MKTIAAENAARQRELMRRYEDLDPCTICGAIDPDFRSECKHRVRDDEFGLPVCEW